ncbi:MAG: PLP-dependent transferase [Candidatus Latescibacteria bacterium]|nr:PLP-dependent transferase [Candidatus Latescibacterota bacterium]
MGFATDAIHIGQGPDPETGAVTIPLYATSTFASDELGRSKGFDYSRTNNPTRQALEQNVAALEGGRFARAFSSGVAAICAAVMTVDGGSHIIVTDPVYGGSYRLFEQVLKGYGLEFSYVDASDAERVRAAITPRTRMVYMESPTNPLMTLVDLRAVSDIAREHGLLHVVDNTFMSPYFQRPLDLGTDIVVHSSTKYLNGHSDLLGGIAVTNDDALAGRLHLLQRSIGAVPSAFDCWLTLRGIKTLAVRMRQHQENAMQVARYLEQHPKVTAVYYPGLERHPQHNLAKRQMSGFGGMLSFEVDGLDAARTVVNSLRIFALAVSLGGVESLVEHPAMMSHASIPREVREHSGIRDGLIRLSVGIEDVEDLIGDLDAALARA